MHDLKLHIVAFDVPYPPDYGGAIDVFYKVKNLSKAGIKIYLHCPLYGNRRPSGELEQLCEKVFYYHRNTGIRGISLKLPYMVYSRKNDELIRNLIQIEAPVFFDGVSTSYYLSHNSIKDRLKILRPQNVEQDYYSLLAKREHNFLKKLYYKTEAKLLQRYEANLDSADAFFTVALHDHNFFKGKYPHAIHQYIPSFQPYDEVKTKKGLGGFCLYHGNLGLAENREAALYLLEEIIPRISFPFVIAGRNPDSELYAKAEKLQHCKVVANPTMQEMNTLISDAQIHVLPTFQNTGLKLKLLHALFNGRHVVINAEMVHGTGLGDACVVCNDSESMIEEIHRLKEAPIDEDSILQRERLLSVNYNNKLNAEKIITFLQRRSL